MTKNKNIKKSIGIFDSGIGGLTFLSAAKKLMPNENFIYYGDNKNAPYGNLSAQKIYKLTKKAFLYFKLKRVKAVVIACNTVTAECIEKLRKKYSFKIIGTEPAIKPALKGKNAAVICTLATAKSQKFNNLIKDKNNVAVFALKDLAFDIEKNIHNIDALDLNFLKPIINEYENIVLGCTHYIFIKQRLKLLGANNLFDGNFAIAKNLYNYLIDKKLLNNYGGKTKFVGSGKLKNRLVYKLIEKGKLSC